MDSIRAPLPVCSSVYILNSTCQVLLSRDFRGDISASESKRVLDTLRYNLNAGNSEPITRDPEQMAYAVHVGHNDIYIACVASHCTDILALFVFLHQLISLFCTYFDTFAEESVRDNFVIIYELLDEVMDHGYPQLTDPAVLAEFIKVHAHRYEVAQTPLAATKAVTWRKEGISYKKNEIFIDVMERVTSIVDAYGSMTHGTLTGTVTVRSQLSGTPTCRLSISDRALGSTPIIGSNEGSLEDIRFHPCVDVDMFKSNKIICFIPPDGKFDLMTYRTSSELQPYVDVHASLKHLGKSSVDYIVQLTTHFKEQSTASEVRVEIPVAPDATTPKVHCNTGTVVYEPEKDILLWILKNVKGKRHFKLEARLGLPSTRVHRLSSANIPVRVHFEIPYNTSSIVQVKYLKVLESSGYRALPWVRYITKGAENEFRFRK